MPAPTPPKKVLAAAKVFAREKFGARHRYAMVLHTDQRHPHVHIVLKAEDEQGRRLHVDKPTLYAWRQDFARLMREQGVAANATRTIVRGQYKHSRSSILGTEPHGASYVVRERLRVVATELAQTGRVSDHFERDWSQRARPYWATGCALRWRSTRKARVRSLERYARTSTSCHPRSPKKR